MRMLDCWGGAKRRVAFLLFHQASIPQKAAHLKIRQAARKVTALRRGRYLQRLLAEMQGKLDNQSLCLVMAEAVNV